MKGEKTRGKERVREVRRNKIEESGDGGRGGQVRVRLEGGRKVLPADNSGGGRKKDEGDEEGEAEGR